MLHELPNSSITLLPDKNHNIKFFLLEKYQADFSVTYNINSDLFIYIQTVVDILTHT